MPTQYTRRQDAQFVLTVDRPLIVGASLPHPYDLRLTTAPLSLRDAPAARSHTISEMTAHAVETSIAPGV